MIEVINEWLKGCLGVSKILLVYMVQDERAVTVQAMTLPPTMKGSRMSWLHEHPSYALMVNLPQHTLPTALPFGRSYQT